jgi:hypothetical protein
MNLEKFLTDALATGHARFRLASSARGHEIQRGVLVGASAENLAALCADDATPLDRDVAHDYVLTVESEDGAKAARFTIRVRGGAGAVDEHRVDPLTTGTGQVVGHLVRMLVDERREFVKLAGRLIDRDIAETHELARLRRGLARRGGDEITAKMLELDATDRAAERERSKELVERAFQLGEPLVRRLLPGGEASALARLRASFSDAQLEQLGALLTPVHFGKFFALDTPEKVAAMFIDEISAPLGAQIFAILTKDQQALIEGALGAEIKRREKAKRAETPAPASTNGAPS